MNAHPESELLSAYLDGELAATDRVSLEAHLPACAECRTTLEALRATLVDLRTLDEPEPSPQDSWALRASIARARAAPGRYTRTVVAVAGGAAAVIALFGLLVGLSGRGGSRGGMTAAEAPGVAVLASGANYTEADARARLFAVAGGSTTGFSSGTTKNRATYGSESGAAAEDASSPGAAPAAEPRGAATAAPQYAGDVARCERETVFESSPDKRAVAYEAARYRGRPAFLLFYLAPARDPERMELWVLDRASCGLLYFAQDRI